MRILLNASTIQKGGALQTSAALMGEILRDARGIEWHFAVSRVLFEELRAFGLDVGNFGLQIFEQSPTRDREAARALSQMEKEMRPDAVFTPSGPAYVKFSTPHLLGCSEAWVTHAGASTLRTYGSLVRMAELLLLVAYKGHWFRHADRWVTQTADSRLGLSRRWDIPLNAITVVPNTCGAHYLLAQEAKPFPDPQRQINLLCFSADYRHKNLPSLADIASELRQVLPGRSFSIVTTLPANSEGLRILLQRAQNLGVGDIFVNIGPQPVAKGPDIYKRHDILLMPSLLETFSANLPEAMAMGMPIVATDFGFNRNVCHDAAMYYNPQVPRKAAEAVAQLVANPTLWTEKITRGKVEFSKLPTPTQRYHAYTAILRSMVA